MKRVLLKKNEFFVVTRDFLPNDFGSEFFRLIVHFPRGFSMSSRVENLLQAPQKRFYVADVWNKRKEKNLKKKKKYKILRELYYSNNSNWPYE